jgi:hypothetical protein
VVRGHAICGWLWTDHAVVLAPTAGLLYARGIFMQGWAEPSASVPDTIQVPDIVGMHMRLYSILCVQHPVQLTRYTGYLD